jgi:thiosulfate/3-mercaptopyruvate sulfurtransferase
MRDYISPADFAEVCAKNGITPDTTCVFYGDKSNWWACYACGRSGSTGTRR